MEHQLCSLTPCVSTCSQEAASRPAFQDIEQVLGPLFALYEAVNFGTLTPPNAVRDSRSDSRDKAIEKTKPMANGARGAIRLAPGGTTKNPL